MVRKLTVNDIYDRVLKLEREIRALKPIASTLQVINVYEDEPEEAFTGVVNGYRIKLYRPTANPELYEEYDPDTAGFIQALADALSGDTIWLPPGTYTGDHMIPDGVTVAAMSSLTAVLTGEITVGDNGIDVDDAPGLSDIRIVRTANDATTLKGVINPNTGGCRIVRCLISCIQSGAGDAYGVSVDQDGDLEVFGCQVYAEAGGTAYAGYRDPALSSNLYFINSPVWLDAPFSE